MKMKKLFLKNKKYFFLFLFLFLLLGVFFKVRAGNAPSDVVDCPSGTGSECVKRYGGKDSEWRCQLNMCVMSTPSSLDDYQKAIKQAEQTGEENGQRFSAEMLGGIAGGLTTALVGDQTENQDGQQGYQNGGIIGLVANLNSTMISYPPASGVEYLADLGKNFGFVHTAYAQGTGFEGLSKLLSLWKASRNLAYILFIIAFIYIGLAIMFRIKISPQAIVTIQNALPKLVIALILVTFSYAIAGLMLDLINLLIYLAVAVLGQAAWPGDIAKISSEQYKYTHLHFSEIWGLLFGGGFKAVNKALSHAYFSQWNGFASLGKVPGAVLGFVIGNIFALLFSVAAFFLTIKLFFSLLSSYVAIIISVITAPLQIVLGLIPGSQGGFGSWFKNLLANVLVFPAVAIVLLLGWLLTGASINTIGVDWVPPTLFWTAGAGGNMLVPVIGFGILMLITKVPDMVKKAFKVTDAGYGTAIGQAVKPSTGMMNAGYQEGGTKALQLIGREIKSQSVVNVTGSIFGIRKVPKLQKGDEEGNETPPAN